MLWVGYRRFWQMKTKARSNRFIYLAYYDEYMNQNPMYKLRLKQVIASSRPALCLSQAGILLSGLLLIVSWRYLVDKFLLFEATGFGVLGEIWCVVVAAVVMGLSGCKFIRREKAKRSHNAGESHFYPGLKGYPGPHRPDALTWGSGAAGGNQKPHLDTSRPKWLHDHEAEDNGWQRVSELPIPARPSARQSAQGGPTPVPDNVPVTLPALGGLDAQVKDPEKSDAQAADLAASDAQVADPVSLDAEVADSIPSDIEAAGLIEEPPKTVILSALEALQASSSTADQARHLYTIAEAVLANLSEVEQITKATGITTILNAVDILANELQQSTASVEVSAATLQVSWVLLLVSKGPDATKAEWVECEVVRYAAKLMMAVAASPFLKVDARSTVLRNLCWMLFTLCDATALPNVHINQDLLQNHSPAVAQELLETGVIPLLGSQTALAFGLEPASFAAPLLALLCQLHLVAEDVSDVALEVVFRPECLQGLCFVLHNRTSDERCCTVLTSLLHFLISRKVLTFMKALIMEHLLGSFLQIMPLDLCRMFICNLLSSAGQEVLAAVEDAYQLDVPLALAQVIPSGCHLILPGSTIVEGEEAPPTCTCALTCRLLLLRDRLPELIAAFFEDLGLDQRDPSESDPDQIQSPQSQMPAEIHDKPSIPDSQPAEASEVVMCVLELVSFLMSQDLEIQKFRHIRGLGIDCSSSSNATTVSAVSEGGFEPEQLLPCTSSKLPASRVTPYDFSRCEITPLEDEACPGWTDADASTSTASGSFSMAESASYDSAMVSQLCSLAGRTTSNRKGSTGADTAVRFDMGGGRIVEVDFAGYQKLKQASKFLRSVLIRTDKQSAINVLRVPQFSDEENAWGLSMLLKWTSEKHVEGLNAEQAKCLWQMAEFFQVDDLQSHCEDIMASLLDDPAVMCSAFELGASHLSGARLLHMCTSHMMQNLELVVQSPVFKHLHLKYRVHLEARLVQEVRDRLAAICSLNGGVAFELPNVSNFEA